MSNELAQLGRIVRLAADADADLNEFIDAVGLSPTLSSDVIRIANSSLYGMEGQVSRLDRATLILGFRTVAQIAGSVLTSRRLRKLELGSLSGGQLWLHGLQVAITSQLVARTLNLGVESEAYLSGLLHDLGIAELYQLHGARYAELLRCGPGDPPLQERERELLGTSHADWIGERAMEWGFPQEIAWALAAHHAPAEGAQEARTLATIVRAAHVIVGAGEAGWTDEPLPTRDCAAAGERVEEAGASVLEELGLGPEDVADIRQLGDEQLKQASALY